MLRSVLWTVRPIIASIASYSMVARDLWQRKLPLIKSAQASLRVKSDVATDKM